MPLARPCIDCGRPTRKSPCATCAQARGRHYGSAYRKRRDAALAQATHCTNCGDPFTPSNPATGGHTQPIRRGGSDSPITPQCRRCNYGWQTTDL